MQILQLNVDFFFYDKTPQILLNQRKNFTSHLTLLKNHYGPEHMWSSKRPILLVHFLFFPSSLCFPLFPSLRE